MGPFFPSYALQPLPPTKALLSPQIPCSDRRIKRLFLNFGAHQRAIALKANRKNDIQRIIAGQRIGSQDELLAELRRLGHTLTQATLSRNLREMRVGRMPDPEKGYVYVLPEALPPASRKAASHSTPAQSIVGLEFSYNFGILRTLPGFASSVATLIDSMRFPSIAGTIAGDDTVLIIPREPHPRTEVIGALQRIFPGITPSGPLP